MDRCSACQDLGRCSEKERSSMFDEMSEAPHLRKKTKHLRAYVKLKACQVGGLTAT